MKYEQDDFLMMESVVEYTNLSISSMFYPPPVIGAWRLKLIKLRPEEDGLLYAYDWGSCDIFPMWYVSAVISYMKESGDFNILEEIRLQDGFNNFCRLSGEFASMLESVREEGLPCPEDIICIGLFLCVCKEYMELCKFLGWKKEYASAALRLKWASDFESRLEELFSKAEFEWLPYLKGLLENQTCRRIKGNHFDYRGEIGQFLLSGIFDIMRIYSKKRAQKYWLATSPIWSSRTTVELIYGIRAGFGGLVVQPCLPDGFDDYRIRRTFRNAIYEISVINPKRTGSEIRKLVVDNAEYLGNQLPNFADGKTHRVEVTIGSFD